jgi:hypothetical protein
VTETKPERTGVIMVYEGPAISVQQALLYRWRIVPADVDWTDDVRVTDEWRVTQWKKPLAKHAAPGMVYSFETEAGNPGASIYTHTAKFLGIFGNAAWVRQHQAQADALLADFRAMRDEKRIGLKKQYLEALEPIRRAYWNLGSPQQAIMLAKVVRAITSSRKL